MDFVSYDELKASWEINANHGTWILRNGRQRITNGLRPLGIARSTIDEIGRPAIRICRQNARWRQDAETSRFAHPSPGARGRSWSAR